MKLLTSINGIYLSWLRSGRHSGCFEAFDWSGSTNGVKCFNLIGQSNGSKHPEHLSNRSPRLLFKYNVGKSERENRKLSVLLVG